MLDSAIILLPSSDQSCPSSAKKASGQSVSEVAMAPCANPVCLNAASAGRSRCGGCRIYYERNGYERPERLMVRKPTDRLGRHVPSIGDEDNTITLEQWHRDAEASQPDPTCSVSWCQGKPYLEGACKLHHDMKALGR